MNRPVALAALAVLCVGIAFVVLTPFQEGKATVVFLTGQPVEIRVEVADSPEEQWRGLMFRESLGEREGMLFIFGEEQALGFWMKDTLIPLDMIFLDGNRTVVKIHTAVPCEADPCPIYSSGRPAQYVVEVNAGFAEQQGIREGVQLEFRGLRG